MTRRRKLKLQAVLVWKLLKIWGTALRIALRRAPGIISVAWGVFRMVFREEMQRRKGGKHS